MSLGAKTYIGGVIALGAALLAGSPLISQPESDWKRFFAYLAMVVLASAMKVRLPGIRGTCSLNFVVYLLAIAQLTLAETVYLVCAGTVVQCVWRTARRPSLVQVAFNVTAMVVSVLPSFAIHSYWPGLPVLTLAAGLFYTLDTALVSTVIALTQDRSLSQVWNICYLWTLPYYLVGAVAAASAEASRLQFGWTTSLLVMPLMYMVFRHYRLVVSNHSVESPTK